MEVVMEGVTLHKAMAMTVDVWDGITKDIIAAVYYKQGNAYETVNLKGETERYFADAIKSMEPAEVPADIADALEQVSVGMQEKREIEDKMKRMLKDNEQHLREAQRRLKIATQMMTKEEFTKALSDELHRRTDMDARVSVLCYAEGKEMIVVDDMKHVKRNAFINDFPFIARYIGRGKVTIDEQAADYKEFVQQNVPETDHQMEAISWRTSVGSEIDANNRMNVYQRYFIPLQHGFSRKSIITIMNNVKTYA